MKRQLLLVLVIGLFAAAISWGCRGSRDAKRDEGQAKAVTEIQKFSGTTTIDENDPDKPVIAVSLERTKVTDAGLERLKGLTKLESLDLRGTKISDAGLKQIKGLMQLHYLCLTNTEVTDAGLKHLKGLTQLQHLYLTNTKVTDAGLERLKGLTRLESLDLWNTKVTDEGVKKLQRALPSCRVYH